MYLRLFEDADKGPLESSMNNFDVDIDNEVINRFRDLGEVSKWLQAGH